MLVSRYIEKFLELRLCLAPALAPRQCFGGSNSEGYKSVLTWLFSKYILFLKKNKTVFCGEMATNGRKRYFHVDENAISEQIYALLDDVESADKGDIDNLMNDSYTLSS